MPDTNEIQELDNS